MQQTARSSSSSNTSRGNGCRETRLYFLHGKLIRYLVQPLEGERCAGQASPVVKLARDEGFGPYERGLAALAMQRAGLLGGETPTQESIEALTRAPGPPKGP